MNNLNGLVTAFAETEQSMISVERVCGYINSENEEAGRRDLNEEKKKAHHSSHSLAAAVRSSKNDMKNRQAESALNPLLKHLNSTSDNHEEDIIDDDVRNNNDIENSNAATYDASGEIKISGWKLVKFG